MVRNDAIVVVGVAIVLIVLALLALVDRVVARDTDRDSLPSAE